MDVASVPVCRWAAGSSFTCCQKGGQSIRSNISCRGADAENLFFSCVAKRLLSVSLVTTVWPTALLPVPWERLPTDGCSERLDAGQSRSYLHGNAGFVTLRENIVTIFFFGNGENFFNLFFWSEERCLRLLAPSVSSAAGFSGKELSFTEREGWDGKIGCPSCHVIWGRRRGSDGWHWVKTHAAPQRRGERSGLW